MLHAYTRKMKDLTKKKKNKILIEGFTRNAVPRVVLYLFKGRIRITIPVTLDEINSIIFHKIFRISRAAGCEKGTIERFVRH